MLEPAAGSDLDVEGRPLLAVRHWRGRRGLLVLLRAEGRKAFDPDQVAIGQEFALLASVALAVRASNETESENLLLRELAHQLRRGEQKAQRNSDLLKEIMDLLPDRPDGAGPERPFHPGQRRRCGQFATARRCPDRSLAGRYPVGGSGGRATRRHDAGTLPTDKLITAEETVGPDGERTLLTSHKPVRIFDETLLLSASLDITERKRVESELARRAYFDELTGLGEKHAHPASMRARSARQGKDGRFALAFIDLDNFKHINDYYSHAVGDALLVKVAARIAATHSRHPTCSRGSAATNSCC